MKSITITVALTLLYAQAAAQLPSREQMVAQAVKDYAAVIGGEALDRRCKFLGDERAASYRADIGVITPALEKDIGNPGLLELLRNSAVAEAESDKHADCGPQAREIVDASSAHAENWAAKIREFHAVGEQAFIRSLEEKMQDSKE